MKLSEIEKEIEQGRFSDELFCEFQAALKRIPKSMRCQHCYTSAYHLKDTRPYDGIRLIKFGLDNYDSDWVDKMRANLNLGGIYEAHADYTSAKDAYKNALIAVPEDKKNDYVSDLSMQILRTELHLNNFEYTEYIHELYRCVIKADPFTASSRSFIFYRAITELIIAKKKNNKTAQKASYNTAVIALDGEKTTGMDILFRRHKYKDDARATKHAIAFLKSNK